MAAPLPDIRPDSLLLTRRSRITLFCCTAVLGYLLTGLLTTLLIYKFGTANARVLRIAAIAQDILALIAPALVTAMMVTRLPAQLLELRGGVPGRLWMASLTLFLSYFRNKYKHCFIKGALSARSFTFLFFQFF